MTAALSCCIRRYNDGISAVPVTQFSGDYLSKAQPQPAQRASSPARKSSDVFPCKAAHVAEQAYSFHRRQAIHCLDDVFGHHAPSTVFTTDAGQAAIGNTRDNLHPTSPQPCTTRQPLTRAEKMRGWLTRSKRLGRPCYRSSESSPRPLADQRPVTDRKSVV